MYTLQNFQDAVIDTKNKLERLLSYFNSLDKHTKKTIEIWNINSLIKEVKDFMLPEMNKLLNQISEDNFPQKRDRRRLSSLSLVIDSWPCLSLLERKRNENVWDRINEVGSAIVDLNDHYFKDLD